MADIARPDLPNARRRRRLLIGGAAVVVLAAVSFAVSRLQPAAPVVERIRLFPGAPVTPDTVILELSNPALDQAVRDAALQVRAAEAQLANRRAELEMALLATQATLAQAESDAREAGLQVRAGVVVVLQQVAVELGARVGPGTDAS